MATSGIFRPTMQSWNRAVPFLLLSAALVLAACASAPQPATVIRTLYNPDAGSFQNVLVIGVAGDFPSRATFEDRLSRAITDTNVTASPYYTVIGRRPRLARSHIHDAIRVRSFDAVIFTRLKGQEQEDLAPMRPVGRNFDLFSYDYDELNRDIGIREARAITFVTEVYSTATQKKIWAAETLSNNFSTADGLIEQQALTIATQLREDGLFDD